MNNDVKVSNNKQCTLKITNYFYHKIIVLHSDFYFLDDIS